MTHVYTCLHACSSENVAVAFYVCASSPCESSNSLFTEESHWVGLLLYRKYTQTSCGREHVEDFPHASVPALGQHLISRPVVSIISTMECEALTKYYTILLIHPYACVGELSLASCRAPAALTRCV